MHISMHVAYCSMYNALMDPWELVSTGSQRPAFSWRNLSYGRPGIKAEVCRAIWALQRCLSSQNSMWNLLHCMFSGPTCPEGRFKCSDGGRCIRAQQICNGRNDCSDGSDETGCSGSPDGGNKPGLPSLSWFQTLKRVVSLKYMCLSLILAKYDHCWGKI